MEVLQGPGVTGRLSPGHLGGRLPGRTSEQWPQESGGQLWDHCPGAGWRNKAAQGRAGGLQVMGLAGTGPGSVSPHARTQHSRPPGVPGQPVHRGTSAGWPSCRPWTRQRGEETGRTAACLLPPSAPPAGCLHSLAWAPRLACCLAGGPVGQVQALSRLQRECSPSEPASCCSVGAAALAHWAGWQHLGPCPCLQADALPEWRQPLASAVSGLAQSPLTTGC